MAGERTISERHGHGMRSSVLTDFEFRVWIQYQNSADDFGVMRMTPLQIQSDNAALAKRKQGDIQKALESLVTVRLIHTFLHQGVTYVYQQDWQTFQKRTYVRKTTLPKPPVDCLRECDALTQQLFRAYPGGVKTKGVVFTQGDEIPGTFPELSKNLPGTFLETSEKVPEKFFPHAISTNTKDKDSTQKQESRNPEPVSSNGHSSPLGRDEQWEIFKGTYPAKGREQGYMALQWFLKGCDDVGFDGVLAGVQRYAKSKNVKAGFVMGMGKWLEKGLWIQEPEVEPTAEDSVEKMNAELAKIDAARAARGR